MTEVIATGETITLTLSDGEERTALLLPDGSWSCPWDGTPCTPGEEHYESRGWPYPCPSPACMAGGRGDPASVAGVRLEQQRREEAATQRSWLAQAQETARLTRERSRLEACQEFADEATAEKYCVPCWSKSTSYGMFLGPREKRIRHRSAESCPVRKRARP